MGTSYSTSRTSVTSDELLQHIVDYGVNLDGAKKIDDPYPNYSVYRVDLDFKKIFRDEKQTFDRFLYDRQRPIDQTRSAKIADTVSEKQFHFWGQIVVGYIYSSDHQISGTPKLLDGQHRLMASQYIDQSKVFPMHLHIIRCSTEEELYVRFAELASSKSVPLLYTTADGAYNYICQRLLECAKVQWSGIFVGDDITEKQHQIKESTFKEILYELLSNIRYQDVDNFSIVDADKTIQFYYGLIESFNLVVKTKTPNDKIFKEMSPKDREKYYNKAKAIDCYIGLLGDIRAHLFEHIINNINRPDIVNNIETDSDDDDDSSQSSDDDESIPDPEIIYRQECIQHLEDLLNKRHKSIIKATISPQIPNLTVKQLSNIATSATDLCIDRYVGINDEQPQSEWTSSEFSKRILKDLDKFTNWLIAKTINDPLFSEASCKASTRLSQYDKCKNKNCFFSLIDFDRAYKLYSNK